MRTLGALADDSNATVYRDAVSTIIDALVLVLDAQPQQAQRWDELAHALRLAEQHQATLKLVPKLQQRLAWWRRYHFRGTPAHGRQRDSRARRAANTLESCMARTAVPRCAEQILARGRPGRRNATKFCLGKPTSLQCTECTGKQFVMYSTEIGRL